MTDVNSETGKIGWVDLTVASAEELRDFYARVTGWRPQPVSMGDYSDFTMMLPTGAEPVAGICHARGTNAGLPPQWLIYRLLDVSGSDAPNLEVRLEGDAMDDFSLYFRRL